MHIILLILKIIGILLLSVLGLILLLLLLVLFVPLRYRAGAALKPTTEGEEEREGIKKYLTLANAKVSWLLHIISVNIMYSDEITGAIKLFGFSIVKFGGEENNGKRKKDRTKKKKKKSEGIENSSACEAAHEGQIQTVESQNQADCSETSMENCQNTGDIPPEQDSAEADSNQGEAVSENNISTGNSQQSEGSAVQTSGVGEEENEVEESGAEGSAPAGKKSSKVAEKFKNIYNTIIGIIKKLADKSIELSRKLEMINDFRYDVRNRQAISYAWKRLKRIVKHLLPGRIWGYVHYGFEDRALTGYILAGVSTQFGKFGRYLEVRPDFVDECLDYDIKLKGRIRLFTLLRLAACVYFNKDVKYLIKEAKKLKEEM